jgi:phage tail-like protein
MTGIPADRGSAVVIGWPELAKPTRQKGLAPVVPYSEEPLDSRIYNCRWHRLEIEGLDLQPGESVKLLTLTSNSRLRLDDPDEVIEAIEAAEDFSERDFGGWQLAERLVGSDREDQTSPANASRRKILIQSGPGQYLHIALRPSRTRERPDLKIYARYPRSSLIDMLPAVFREEPLSASFLERLLAVFQHDWDEVETTLERFRVYLDPAHVPDLAALHYLAAWFDIRLESGWLLDPARRFLARVLPLRSRRGTPAAAEAWLQAWLEAEGWPNAGRMPRLVEGFRVRRFFALGSVTPENEVVARQGRAQLPRSAALAVEPMGDAVRLDAGARLDAARLAPPYFAHPERQVLDHFGHRVTLYVCDLARASSATPVDPARAPDRPDDGAQSKRLRLLSAARDVLPASLAIDLAIVQPGFRLAADSLLGLNTILARERGQPCP